MNLDHIRQLLANPKDRQAAVAAAKAWQSSTLSWVSPGTKLMAQVFQELVEQLDVIPPRTDRARVGIHGRNDWDWPDADFALLKAAKIECIKMMSHTKLGVFDRIRAENPDILFITRLYHEHFQNSYFNNHKHPTAEEFAAVMVVNMGMIHNASGCDMFEVHNEPNHPALYEGWGVTNEDAANFNSWFLEVYDRIKSKLPWVKLGFPGLAIHNRDLEWLSIAWFAIERADWLGVHCYWQTPNNQPNHLSPDWGLRFEQYHAKFPNKDIHITECGNSNAQSRLPLSDADMARQTVEYYQKCLEYPYVKSASFFLASSPDPNWASFAWQSMTGGYRPVVNAVGGMSR